MQTLVGTNLNAWDGFPIDYGKVTEYLGENGENGKNVYFIQGKVLLAAAMHIDLYLHPYSPFPGEGAP
jgi:hypothetical protein